jgi:hypothetical protein
MSRSQKRSVPAQFVMCRAWQHAWDYHDVQRDGRILIQSLHCIRCGAMKYVKMDGRTGEPVGNTSMKYPDGYLMPEGGPLTHAERVGLKLDEAKAHMKGGA